MRALADITQTATLYNGKPTCFFPSQPFHRVITNIVVINSVASSVQIFRGSVGSIPIASNPVGMNNTITGRITIPAGQQFFVVWSNAAANVSDAYARVSLESSDNPLDEDSSGSTSWAVNVVDSFVVPSNAGPNDPRVVLSSSDPLMVALGENNGVVWYWKLNKAFILATNALSGTNGVLDLIYSGAPGVGQNVLRVNVDDVTTHVDLILGQGINGRVFSSVLHEFDANLVVNGNYLTGQNITANGFLSAFTTVNNFYTDLTAIPAVTLVKQAGDGFTNFRVRLNLTCRNPTQFAAHTLGIKVSGPGIFGGLDFDITSLVMDVVNNRTQMSGEVKTSGIAGVAGGTYTFQVRVKTSSGTFTVDGADFYSLTVEEI